MDEARLIAQSCTHFAQPYTATMQDLQWQSGQPHQLAQNEVTEILNAPDLKARDSKDFKGVALSSGNVDIAQHDGSDVEC